MSVPIMRPRVALAALAALCLASTAAVAQSATPDDRDPIGNAIQIVRQVTGEIQAQFRYLFRRDPVYRDEVIETQPESASRIIFADRTELSVGPSARITLDEFVFDPDPSIGKFFLSAFDGVFRFKSGRLAKTAYAIETPTAVIGVRGTTFATVFGPNGLAAVVLEAGDAVIVDIAASCPNVDAERIINVRDFAVVIDGCDISEPAPPPEWALTQIAALNVLLFELDLQFGNIDIGPDNDSDTPTQRDAAIPSGEITIQPASAPPAPAAIASGPPTPLTPDTSVSGPVGFTHNDQKDPPSSEPGNEPSNDRGNSQPGNTHSGNGTGNGNGNGGNSTAGNSHSGAGAAASNSRGHGSTNASSNSSGGKSSNGTSASGSSNASSHSSGGKSSRSASANSSSKASAGRSGNHSRGGKGGKGHGR